MADLVLNSTAGGHAGFASTQWGLLLSAAAERGVDEVVDAAAQSAWEDLYRSYSLPVYSFVRRRGYTRPQAQDLTQDFFIHLIERRTVGRADPTRGRFRTFLLGALENFLADAARRAGAHKRGGGCSFVFLDDAGTAEQKYELVAPDSQTPERLFETQWAAAVVEATFERLREEMTASSKREHFQTLKNYVAGVEDASYQQAADTLGLSLSAFKSAVHRLRIRYGALLREEVTRTVATPAEVDEEVGHLRATLRAG